MIQAKFCKQRFCDQYKRNNKAKGRKNLRCFPDCRRSGHVKTGYCGRGIGHIPGEKALHPWFPESVTSSTIESNYVYTIFSFNKGNQGWHCAWASQRMTLTT